MRIKLFPSMLDAFSGLLIKTVDALPITNPPTGSVFIYPRRSGGLIELVYRLPDGATGIISGSGSGGSERFQGAYDAETTYLKDETGFDSVEYEGSLWAYTAETPSAGNTPGSESAYWTLRVEKGDPGADGNDGADGADGETWVKYYAIPPAYTATLGKCAALDAVTESIDVDPDGVSGLSELEFQIRSASSVTGNVRLVPTVDGVAGTAVVIPVTAAYVTQKITFASPVTGLVQIVRDHAHVDDTLYDGGVVACALRHLYGHEVRP